MSIPFKLTDEQATALGIKSADEILARLMTPVTPPPVEQVTPTISAVVNTTPTAKPEPSIAEQITAAVTAAVGDVDARVKNAIAAAAVETMAAAGVQPVAASPQSKPMSKSEVLAQYNAIADPKAKGAFYNAHRAEILANA